MKDTEKKIIEDIKKGEISEVREDKRRVVYFWNGWRCEVRKPSEDFIEALKEKM